MKPESGFMLSQLAINRKSRAIYTAGNVCLAMSLYIQVFIIDQGMESIIK